MSIKMKVKQIYKPLYIVILLLAVSVFSGFNNDKPKILIIGDSISIGYTPFVKDNLNGTVIVEHNPGNAQHTGTGLKEVEAWIGDTDWDIIQFNWGLWDLCYRHPDSKVYGNRDKKHGKPDVSIEVYASNLDSLVTIMKEKTSAKLIFVTTTYVPKDEPGRIESDAIKYNETAKAIMKKHGILVNEIYEPSIEIHNTYGMGSRDVHYKKEGYEKLSKLIIDFLEKQIK